MATCASCHLSCHKRKTNKKCPQYVPRILVCKTCGRTGHRANNRACPGSSGCDTKTQHFGSKSPVLSEQLLLNAAASKLPDPAELPFNPSQRQVYDFVIGLVRASSSNASSKVVFVDGPGGTGKTFLFNALLDAVRRENYIALAVAYSGAAATLLKGGRTAHSTFKIPLKVSATSVCNITPRSDVENLLQRAKLVIWDEASMMSKDHVETVDRSLRNIMGLIDAQLNDIPFGGKLVVFGGDFRQILPVIPNATRSQTKAQCLNQTTLWKHVQVKRLTTNMRVQQAQASSDPQSAVTFRDFADFLLSIGSGAAPTIPGSNEIRIPRKMLFKGPDNYSAFADYVFNDFRHPDDKSIKTLVSRTILTPKNSDVSAINDYVVGKFPGKFTEYLSTDTVDDEKLKHSYTVEKLNSMDPSSLPPHRLKLKVGTPVMALRNLSPKEGVCNGTRLICRSFKEPDVIEAVIATGPNAGEIFRISRMDIISNERETVIPFRRNQFPIRLAFSMTINKAQGQTLDFVGLYLPEPVFDHGQLYTAFSRVKRPDAIEVLLKKDASTRPGREGYYTKNIVYKEIIE